MFCTYGEDAAVFGIVAAPDGCACIVSSRVMVRPVGSFPDPLGLRRFVAGPDGPLGEAGRERFLGVKVPEVVVEIPCGIAKGVLFEG